MRTLKTLIFLTFPLILLFSCKDKIDSPIKVADVSPWCILGFDSLDRSPKERIALLQELGISQYGYNKGKGHLDEMIEEFNLAKINDIKITSVFLWLNANRDSIGQLSESNRQLLSNLKEVEYKPTIWLSFSNNFFKELDQEQSLELSVEMIKFIKLKADEVGCKLALYNHHGWFGNPYNQIQILKKLNLDELTMVYNFHHAQDYVDDFPEIVKRMRPYLSFVNLNGVNKEGPQILTIGEGEHEFEMIQLLLYEGYNGPWGILGHIKTEDVKEVLQRNINGLKLLNAKLIKEDRK